MHNLRRPGEKLPSATEGFARFILLTDAKMTGPVHSTAPCVCLASQLRSEETPGLSNRPGKCPLCTAPPPTHTLLLHVSLKPPAYPQLSPTRRPSQMKAYHCTTPAQKYAQLREIWYCTSGHLDMKGKGRPKDLCNSDGLWIQRQLNPVLRETH